jgi:hypothetical protein
MRAYFGAVASVEVIDTHTLKITQKYPSQMLLPALASYGLAGFMLVSPTSYKTWGKRDLLLHPVGTGPFKFVKWDQNQVVLLERNAAYWKPGLPYIDRLEFKIIKEGVTRMTALRRGEVDFANRLPIEQVGLVAKDPKIQLLKGPDMALVFTFFNRQRKPFDDIRVRQALGGYALNRDEFAKVIFLGQAVPLVSVVPPGALGHLDFPELYPYNPEKAKALLKAAGYDERNPLQYTILLNPFNSTFAAPLKTQLEKLGVVKVTVEVVDHPIFLKRLRTHELDQGVTQSYPFLEAAERFRQFESDAKGGARPRQCAGCEVGSVGRPVPSHHRAPGGTAPGGGGAAVHRRERYVLRPYVDPVLRCATGRRQGLPLPTPPEARLRDRLAGPVKCKSGAGPNDPSRISEGGARPNKALQPTAYSVRSAPAFGSG